MDNLIIHSYNGSQSVQKAKFKRLFNEAFIRSERMNAALMSLLSLKKGIVFNLVTDEKDTVVGFYYIYSKENMLFLYYLAVDKEYRGCGYGNKILLHLENTYASNPQSEFYVIAESIREGKDVSDIKIRRSEFYKRFGFELTDYIVCDNSGAYDLYKKSSVKGTDIKQIKKIIKKLNPIEICKIKSEEK